MTVPPGVVRSDLGRARFYDGPRPRCVTAALAFSGHPKVGLTVANTRECRIVTLTPRHRGRTPSSRVTPPPPARTPAHAQEFGDDRFHQVIEIGERSKVRGRPATGEAVRADRDQVGAQNDATGQGMRR